MEIMVYFNSGDKARFNAEKVSFDIGECYPLDSLRKGITCINWDNVCFIREVKPKEEDEE